jgi:hypothetical protein
MSLVADRKQNNRIFEDVNFLKPTTHAFESLLTDSFVEIGTNYVDLKQLSLISLIKITFSNSSTSTERWEMS